MSHRINTSGESSILYARIRRANGIVAVDDGDGLKLVDDNGGEHVITSSLGRSVWALLHDGPAFPELLDRLGQCERKPAHRLTHQTGTILTQWREIGLVRIAG